MRVLLFAMYRDSGGQADLLVNDSQSSGHSLRSRQVLGGKTSLA